jgi:hypothetical protein
VLPSGTCPATVPYIWLRAVAASTLLLTAASLSWDRNNAAAILACTRPCPVLPAGPSSPAMDELSPETILGSCPEDPNCPRVPFAYGSLELTGKGPMGEV